MENKQHKIRNRIRVKIRPSHATSIDELIEKWDFKTKEKMLGLLRGYPSRNQSSYQQKKQGIRGAINFLFPKDNPELEIKYLNNIKKLDDLRFRFEITDEVDSNKSFDKIFEDELGEAGIYYAVKKLKEKVKDIYVPREFGDLLWQSYRKFICKNVKLEEESGIALPKAPLFLVIGPSGGGKSATVKEAINDYLFQSMIMVEEDYSEKIEKLREEKPLLWEADNPEIAEQVENQRLRDKFFRYKNNSRILNKLFKKRPEFLDKHEEFQQLMLEKIVVEPSDVQTAFYGETGNRLKKKIGDTNIPKIIHFEEFQNIAFGVNKGGGGSKDLNMSQQGTLNTTLNALLDNVRDGNSPMIIVATTNAPDKIEKDIYRRFDESGMVIDISNYWKDKKNLQPIVKMEAERHNINISEGTLEKITKSLYRIFEERTLEITPAYVRKLLSTVIEEKKTLNAKLFEDRFILRKAFENVARNSHENLFNKIVKRPSKDLKWKDYKGRIKDNFAAHANAGLRFNDENKKGVVLFGPPGGGKTFLTKVYASSNPDLTYLSVKLQDLQNPENPIEGMIDNINTMYNIARMMAPTLINLQEIDAVIEQRSKDGSNPFDKVTNTFLDIFDGDVPLRGVYTAMTTNLPEKIDPAFIRSKRADLLEVTGRLSEKNKKDIISNQLEGMVLDEEVNFSTIYQKVEGICYVPADYAKFVEDIAGLQNSQYKVIKWMDGLFKNNATTGEIAKFIEQNTKPLLGILKYYGESSRVIEDAKQKPLILLDHLDMLEGIAAKVHSLRDFPAKTIHLDQVYRDFTNDPIRVGLERKKKVMSYEVSKEPQPGFVIGVGANDLFGILTPIKTSLPDKESNKIEVSGAVKTNSVIDGEANRGVGQMEHSALEAKTLVENYLSQLFSERKELRAFNPTWAINELLSSYSIHHQFLTADYSGGGPSAGFALSINTLSILLNLDVMNDFGVTGAPWTGGRTKKDVGSSVIIGGAPQKADAVLNEKLLMRMFVPHKNYRDIPLEQHESYWSEGKLVRPVYNFRQLVPEVYCFNSAYKNKINQLIELQVGHNIGEINKHKNTTEIKERLDNLMNGMRTAAEDEIVRRAKCLYNFSIEDSRQKDALSFFSIYEKGGIFDKTPKIPKL